MKHFYIEKNFRSDSLALVETMNLIIDEYQIQGFILTVRQLYYQLVARDIIPNTLIVVKRVASIINDAKLAGIMDWSALEDRTREFIIRGRWNDGAQILRACHDSFHMDMWDNQQVRPFVIVEKEALVGVLERTCNALDIPLLAARGYPSGSVLRDFAVNMLQDAIYHGQDVIIFHLGDHDPSGIDMTRDLQERLDLFTEDPVKVERIALNMDQIREQRPPENPAKTTDSRFKGYRRQFGSSSWELDALTPQYLDSLVRQHVDPLIDEDNWRTKENEILETKSKIAKAADTFNDH